jgi:hypothetical protein
LWVKLHPDLPLPRPTSRLVCPKKKAAQKITGEKMPKICFCARSQLKVAGSDPEITLKIVLLVPAAAGSSSPTSFPHRCPPPVVSNIVPLQHPSSVSSSAERPEFADSTTSRLQENCVTPRFRGPNSSATHICMLGLSLTHMMTHDTETDVKSLIYNRVMYKNS